MVIQHYGIPGMHWGVRRAERRLNKEAKKDAKKFVQAKMDYGEGAGTRRKLVAAELAKKLKDPSYKKSFDDAVEAVNLAAAANKARRNRAGRDAKNQVIRSTKMLAKTFAGTTSLAAGVILYVQNKPVVDKFVAMALRKIKI